MLIDARRKLIDSGDKLHSSGGNAVALTYPAEYPPTKTSMDAFEEGIKGSGIKLIGISSEGFGAANGYTGAQKLIARYKDQGIDLVYAMDDQILQGAVKAFREAGYVFNKNVAIVGTVCHGDRRLLEDGTEYATSLQAPLLDAQLSIKVAEEYLKDGKLKSFINTFPDPTVRWDQWRTMKLTDYHGVVHTMDELCPWKRTD
jgi:ABC-type sugar transport system substrate-binding protein